MSRAHLTLEERIGIEVFAHMGMIAEQLPPALARHHHFRQAAPGQLQIRPNPAPAPGLLIAAP